MAEQLKQTIQQLETKNQQLEQENSRIIGERANQLTDAFNRGYAQRTVESTATDLELKEDMMCGMEAITMELRMQSCCSNIRPFGGENSQTFQNWAQDIERNLSQLGHDDSRARTLALKTLTGPAADYATREIQDRPNISWLELKARLNKRYNDLADVLFSRQKLRQVVQSRSESVQNYFERLLSHARQAYGDGQLDNPFVQMQLTELFMDGLLCDATVKRLIRAKPKTLDQALELATSEQQAQKAFDLRRGVNDMEIDAISTEQPESLPLNNEMSEIRALMQSNGILLQQIAQEMDSTLGAENGEVAGEWA